MGVQQPRPNDEAFSFQGNGCNALFMDGHVTFLTSDVDALVFRRLLTPSEGVPVADSSGQSFLNY